MFEWLATSILSTANGLPLEASDAWATPYVEPVKGERIALRLGELRTAVAGLKADVRVVPWMPNLAKVVATVSLRNPGSTWLRWVRIDLEASDEARIARTVYTSFLVSALKPGESATRTNDRLWVHVRPAELGKLRFKTQVQVVGGFRLQTTPPK
jgi:hypothetical protein